MQCCVCKEKPATVHLTQIVGDKMQKRELCMECAKAIGLNDENNNASVTTICDGAGNEKFMAEAIKLFRKAA